MVRIRVGSVAALATVLLGVSGCVVAGDDQLGTGTTITETTAAPSDPATSDPASPGPPTAVSVPPALQHPGPAGPTTAPPTPGLPASTPPPEVESVLTEADLGLDPPVREHSVSGSGCSPGTDVLPAGWWYGTVEGPPDDNGIRFDLACYYWGAAAAAQAASQGVEAWDYFIVDDNPKVRAITVTTSATASCLTMWSAESFPCSPYEVSGMRGVWIRVQAGGEVDRIVEQYAP